MLNKGQKATKTRQMQRDDWGKEGIQLKWTRQEIRDYHNKTGSNTGTTTATHRDLTT